jgi:hypothetical protein
VVNKKKLIKLYTSAGLETHPARSSSSAVVVVVGGSVCVVLLKKAVSKFSNGKKKHLGAKQRFIHRLAPFLPLSLRRGGLLLHCRRKWW